MAQVDRLRADSLLVASPSLVCPFFARSLVLLIDHSEEGAFGLVVNRATGLSLADVVEDVGILRRDEVRSSVPVMVGGPVAADAGFVILERSGDAPADATPVGRSLAISASTRVLSSVARGEVGGRAMLCLGYAGWGPGQLDKEAREGSWIPCDVAVDLVLGMSPEERWETALRNMGIEPGLFDGRVVASA